MTIKYDKEICDEIFLQAYEESQKGNKRKAFLLYLKAAELGDPEVQNTVGVCYDVGDGVKRDSNLALYWYKKAWRNGADPGVCSNMASLYMGIGNRRRAVYWWKKGVNAGDGGAALDLAILYLTGRWFTPNQWDQVVLDSVKFEKTIMYRSKGIETKAIGLLKRVGKSNSSEYDIEMAELLLKKLKEMKSTL